MLTPTQSAPPPAPPAEDEFFAIEDKETPSTRLGRLFAWAQRVRLPGKLAFLVGIIAVLSAAATYAVMSQSVRFAVSEKTARLLLLGNSILLLVLVGLIAYRLTRMWLSRRSRAAGSRLQSQLVALCSAVAIAPTIIVAGASVYFLEISLRDWFSDPIRQTLNYSRSVAEGYVNEHRKVIEADVLSMAYEINNNALMLASDPATFETLIAAQARVRTLAEAMVIDGQLRVRAGRNFGLGLGINGIPEEEFTRAQSGEVAIWTSDEHGRRVQALVRLDRFIDAYLFVSRYMDPTILENVDRAQNALNEFDRLERQRGDIQKNVNLIFIIVALVVLMAAIWVGLWVAARLVAPVRRLVVAAEAVRGGNLNVRVPEGPEDHELGILSRAFNRMTTQLRSQQNALVQANQQLDSRRRFTETVLAGVTAGVIGLDRNATINLPNRSAAILLSTPEEDLTGKPLADMAPEMIPLLTQAQQNPAKMAEGQVDLVRDGQARNLLVRVRADRPDAASTEPQGYVITFDDITELMSAQRTAAWADVARRIAHEIKNPLTPIQLSAERLKRRYLSEIQTEPAIFSQCTDTIIRQVGDLRRMVDEFSAFARMPRPVLAAHDLKAILNQALFLERMAHGHIDYRLNLPDGPLTLVCDEGQITQILTNLLKNARESIESNGQTGQGVISIAARADAGRVEIEISDNGRGFPEQLKARLTEPYITTRAKGTGLGLAIVKKIMDDHAGQLRLEDRPGGGATVKLIFPLGEAADAADGLHSFSRT